MAYEVGVTLVGMAESCYGMRVAARRVPLSALIQRTPDHGGEPASEFHHLTACRSVPVYGVPT